MLRKTKLVLDPKISSDITGILFNTYPHLSYFHAGDQGTTYSISLQNKQLLISLTCSIKRETMNPCALNPDQQQKLYQIISLYHEKMKGHFSYKSYYQLEEKENNLVLFCSLTHNLIERGRKLNHQPKTTRINGRRFEVYQDKILGEGSYSLVYRSLGTLILCPDNRFIFKEKDQRIIKIYKDHVSRADIIYESSIAKVATHLNAKPLLSKALVSDYFPSTDVMTLILDDIAANEEGQSYLTLKQRFMYSIAICRAVDTQMHQKGIIIRDIKTDNIRIDDNNGKVIAHIIDVGLSKLKRDPNNNLFLKGFYLYKAPEFYYHLEYDEKADCYGLARIIAELFGYDGSNVSIEDVIEEYKSGMNFDGLFDTLSEEEIDYCGEDVKSVLLQLAALNPNDRISAHAAAERLTAIYVRIENTFISALEQQLNYIITLLDNNYLSASIFNPHTDTLYIQKSVLTKLIEALRGNESMVFSEIEIKSCANGNALDKLLSTYEGILPASFIQAEEEFNPTKTITNNLTTKYRLSR
jgi:serine/threonine protein kinase